jgi:hypothetical protein
MKKILLVVTAVFLFLCSGPAWADEVDDTPQPMVNEQIRIQTRQMIQSGVPEDNLLKMTRMMATRQFPERDIIQAQKTVMMAHNNGGASEPVMNKAFEGMAKNIPASRIVQAMGQVQTRYAFAFKEAGALSKDSGKVRSIGTTIAEGLSAGMKEGDVRQIMDQLHERSRLQDHMDMENLALRSFETTRTMARLGAPSSKTAEVVCQALQNRYSANEMTQLENRFRTQTRDMSAEQVANQYARGLAQGAHVSGLGSQSGSGYGDGGHGGGGGYGGGGHGGGGYGGGGGGR